MMKKLMVLLVFFHAASAAKHSLRFYLMISSGVSNFPDYVVTGDVDGVLIAYYDSTMQAPEPRQDWVREFIEDDPELWETLIENCKNYQLGFNSETSSFKQHSNQTGGVHVIQQIMGCEQDDETKQISGFKQFGYNGEDFIAFDLKKDTWTTSNPMAEPTKQEWDRNKANGIWKNVLEMLCPDWLKTIYLSYGKHFLDRKVLPSLSLLQKTPSSPVTCHTTGFYPDTASLVWRKDGEELHEGVDHGEILPNNDGTFQMSTELNISSVTPEDWRRYDCMFQLSGVKDDIITRLNKSVIRTNWGKTGIRNDEEKPSDLTTSIIAAVVVLVLIVIAAVGFIVYKKTKGKHPTSSPGNISEFSERLNPEAM